MRIGVDLGGTKTELIALDESGATRHRVRVPTPAHEYDAIIACIAGLVHDTERLLGARASVGVGTPGARSLASGLWRNSNTTVLNGRAFDRDLGGALQREIRVANDANCFVLSEAVDGAGRDARVLFGVILGTGVGGGIAIDQRALEGRNAIAGEWGHNPLPWPQAHELPGPACYCGKHGCIETFLSGPGLARDYEVHEDPALDAIAIVQRMRAGETAASAAFERYCERLARALASVINLLDPDLIVLGGGLSLVDELYPVVMRQLSAFVFCDRVDTRVVRSQHGDSSGVRGAAFLWPESA